MRLIKERRGEECFRPASTIICFKQTVHWLIQTSIFENRFFHNILIFINSSHVKQVKWFGDKFREVRLSWL